MAVASGGQFLNFGHLKKERKIHQVPQMIFRCSKLWVENGGSHMKYHEIITDFGKHSGDPQDHSPVPWKSLPQCVAMRRHASPSATPPIVDQLISAAQTLVGFVLVDFLSKGIGTQLILVTSEILYIYIYSTYIFNLFHLIRSYSHAHLSSTSC